MCSPLSESLPPRKTASGIRSTSSSPGRRCCSPASRLSAVERAEVVARRDPQRAGEVERVRLSTEVLQERGLAVALASRPSSLALPRQRLVLSGAGRGLEPELAYLRLHQKLTSGA